MDKQLDRTYRVIKAPRGWDVTVFHKNEIVGPVTIFSDEALPEWIRREISLLNLVDQQSHIPGIGHRVGPVYWLLPGNSAPHMQSKEMYE
jgi:hypothetical protein